MSCLDLPTSYLALITPSLSKPFTTKQWSCTADFLARENHVAYVASSSSIEQEKAQKSAFHYTPEQQQSPKVLPYQLFFFQKWEVVRFCAKLRMAKIAFPLSRTTDFENGRHHCTKATIQWAPHSQWSPTIKRVFSLSVPLKHTYEKNRIKSISGESKRAKKESRRRRTNETWKNECISII